MSARALPAPPFAADARPLLRGWSHLVAFFVALTVGPAFLVTRTAATHRGACAVYVATLAALFGTSALYHRHVWSPRVRPWLRRLDHSAIFLLVAGTYTPLVRALPAGAGSPILLLAWLGAAAGCLLAILWPAAPKPLSAATYLLLGWMAVWLLPAFERSLGPAVVACILAGGALYTLGALAYALRRPDPWPRVFGYHEIFHALVILAAGCHFAAVTLALHAHQALP